MLRRAGGGDWRMELGADGTTWEPWVVGPGGRRSTPLGLVLKELTEWGRGSSLRGAVAGTLGSHLLG